MRVVGVVPNTPDTWHGVMAMPDGSIQHVHARTLPRMDDTGSYILDKPHGVLHDPVRATWPSR